MRREAFGNAAGRRFNAGVGHGPPLCISLVRFVLEASEPNAAVLVFVKEATTDAGSLGWDDDEAAVDNRGGLIVGGAGDIDG